METRWARLPVRLPDAHARGFVFVTDRRIFFAWGNETRAFPLETIRSAGPGDQRSCDLFIVLDPPEAPTLFSVPVDVLDTNVFTDFLPTLASLVAKAKGIDDPMVALGLTKVKPDA
jgi:hypothetical protein